MSKTPSPPFVRLDAQNHTISASEPTMRTVEEKKGPAIVDQAEWLIQRMLNRLEDDYNRTQKAEEREQYNSSLEAQLFRLETRISVLEDSLECTLEDQVQNGSALGIISDDTFSKLGISRQANLREQQTQRQLLQPTQPISSSSLSLLPLPLDEIQKAMSILGPPPAHVFSADFDKIVQKHMMKR